MPRSKVLAEMIGLAAAASAVIWAAIETAIALKQRLLG